MRRLGTLAILALWTAPAVARLKPGDAMPAVVLATVAGAPIDTAGLRGQVVVVDRWASWCVPCRAELAALDAFAQAHAGQGLRILPIATEPRLAPATIAAIGAGLSFPLLQRAAGTPFVERGGLPTNYVVDRMGVVRYAAVGAFDAAALAQIVAPLLAEAAR